ncbi:Sec-independent protein translocase protein TatA [groundwater metagenome]|uniref:Sec-independent protein translocase protein TatA n=1 Tax=groundwater metagenome TaxID=717931 RepID=A0A098E6Z3_9ZZZZ
MFGLGWQELLFVLVILLLLFGAAKLPELAKSLGKAKKEFEKGIKGEEENKGKEGSNKEAPKSASESVKKDAPKFEN